MSYIYQPTVKKPPAPSMPKQKSYVDKTQGKKDIRAHEFNFTPTPDGQWICRVWKYFQINRKLVWTSPKRETFLGCCREVNEWMEGKT